MENDVIVGRRLTTRALDREEEAHLPDKMVVVESHTPAENLVLLAANDENVGHHHSCSSANAL